MSRTTRSSAPIAAMDVEKPLDTRSRRTFGRDITNAISDPLVSKTVSKPQTFPVVSVESVFPSALNGKDEKNILSKDPREYMRRPVDNIDSRDAGNPLLCTEYVNQMYDHFYLQEKECMVAPDYMKKQAHITDKVRTILIDWLVEVHMKFKQVPETLYLTVQLIDRYLQLKNVRRSKLQLVGIACNLVRTIITCQKCQYFQPKKLF